ncbi:MAG: glycosyltransferase [Bacteroidales bacterium]|nr:glycosyltransferase [Bacteroidales bacterium]
MKEMELLDCVRFVPLCREKGVSESACPAVHSETFLLDMSSLSSLWRMVRIGIGMFFQPLFWRMRAAYRKLVKDQEQKQKEEQKLKLKQGIKYFYAAWAYAGWIRRHRHLLKPGDVIYSYWAHYNLLGIALAKRKGWLPAGVRCISRGHGYDLYEAERGVYFPYRKMSLEMLDGLFPCSEYGAEYMKRRYSVIANRVQAAFLGVWPVGADDEERMRALRPTDKVIRVVSCSSVIPVKRLPLLWKSLAEFSAQLPMGVVLEWHHFGGGEGLSALQAEADAKAAGYPRLKTVWHGQTDNAKLREAYLNTYFHAFINVSESEGLPVSLMEACAAGIPAVATDVGGSGELVRSSGGYLLDKEFEQAAFNQALDAILQGGDTARRTAYNGYQAKFSAERNYTAFYRQNVKL